MAIAKNTAKAEKETKAVPKAVSKVKKVEAAPAPAPVPEAPAAPRLGRKELAAAIRQRIIDSGAAISPKVAEHVVTAFEESVAEVLATGGEVVLPGFGKFVTSHREARVGHNPKTGEAVDIPAKTVPAFKAGAALKSRVHGAADEEGDD